MALDRIDFEILAALQKDGRLTNKELAARVGLAPSSCLERVKHLRASGALRDCHADVAPEALGIGLQALVAVRLKQHSRDVVESFRRHVRSLPEVAAVYHVTGQQDFLVHVSVRDANHLRDFALDAFTTRAEVAHLETSLIFEFSRNPVLPDYSQPPPPPTKRRGGGRR
ncbi:Lrp/AsnC family transcriptional regulator [Myxococcaceae bacterium GXIMD 01537]